MAENQKLKRRNFFNLNRKRVTYLLSFFIPVIVFWILSIASGKYPFGSHTWFTADFGQQYVKMFGWLKQSLLRRKDLSYSLSMGMGNNTIGMWTYYLLNPLNIFYLIFPRKLFSLATIIIYSIQYGLSSLAIVFYLMRKYKENYVMIGFGIAYAFSGWIVANQLNIIWLNIVWMLPLLVRSEEQIIEGRDKKLAFTFLTALAIYMQYYIAMLAGIFIVVYGIYYSIIVNRHLKVACYRLIELAISGIFGLLISAPILVPTYLDLKNSRLTESIGWRDIAILTNNRIDQISQFITGNYGMDMLSASIAPAFVTMVVLCLFILYFCNPAFSKKEKISTAIISVFFIASICNRFLTYLWVGMIVPAWYEYRFLFAIIFFIFIIAYQSFSKMPARFILEEYLICVFVLAGIILAGAIQLFYSVKKPIIKPVNMIIAIVASILAIALIYLYNKRNIKWQTGIILGLTVLLSFEGISNLIIVNDNMPSLEAYQDWNPVYYQNKITNLIKKRDSNYNYRIGQTFYATNMDGIETDTRLGNIFNSNTSKSNRNFRDLWGMVGSDNHTDFAHNNIIDDLLGYKYIVATSKVGFKDYDLLEMEHNTSSLLSGNLAPILESRKDKREKIYKNNTALPIAYKVNNTALRPIQLSNLQNQYNSIINNIAGKNLNLMTETPFTIKLTNLKQVKQNGIISYTKLNDKKDGKIQIKYRKDANHWYYLSIPKLIKKDKYTINNNNNDNEISNYNGPSIFPAGHHIEIVQHASTCDYPQLNIYQVDKQKYNRWIKKMKENRANTKVQTDSKLESTIKSQDNGYLMYTIAYSDGWKVIVNGKEYPIKHALNDFIAVPVFKGKNKIQLKYQTPGLALGIVIGMISLMILSINELIKRKNKPKAIA